MTAMDTRVADRRKGVSEDKARRRLRWVLAAIAVILVAVGTFWLIRSPILSIATIDVTGAERTDPGATIAALGMGVGRPTIDVDGGAIEAAIERDPWIAEATVSVAWPGTIHVDVIEHEPLVPVMAGDSWYLVSADGAVLASAPTPGVADAAVAIDLGVGIGETTADRSVLGALEFLDALPEDLRVGAALSVATEGVVAVVEGHRVVLGRPIDMGAKALVLEGLIASGLESGAEVNLIAPTRPAVANPQPLPEGEE